MIETVEINEPMTLDDYAAIADLAGAVEELRAEARLAAEKLRGRVELATCCARRRGRTRRSNSGERAGQRTPVRRGSGSKAYLMKTALR